MAWYFRKSFKFGLFRINLSKSGIGTSFGVRGARISVGPRGTYVNVGTNGVYYRKRLDTRSGGRPTGRKPARYPNVNAIVDTAEYVNTETFVDTDSQDFIKELEKKSRRTPLLVLLGIIPSFIAITGVLTFLNKPAKVQPVFESKFEVTKNSVRVRDTPSIQGAIVHNCVNGETFNLIDQDKIVGWTRVELPNQQTGYIKSELGSRKTHQMSSIVSTRFDSMPIISRVVLIVASGLVLIYCVWISRLDRRRRSLELNYEMDDRLRAIHLEFMRYFDEFISSKRIWQNVHSEVVDSKYHAGANQLVKRAPITGVSHDRTPIPFLKTNVPIPSIVFNHLSLYFFPERIVIKKGHRFGALQYRNLEIEPSQVKFIESEGVPSDSTVVGRTWQYLNKNGQPDMRFSNNRQFPVCMYSEYTLHLGNGLTEVITTSKLGAMDGLVGIMKVIGELQEKVKELDS